MLRWRQFSKRGSAVAEPAHVLISLEETHADNIFLGRKHVELRRRRMNVKVGTIVWIYVKQPVGAIVGSARVSSTHAHSPSALWKMFSSVSGLTRREFFDYFCGVENGFGLGLDEVRKLSEPISLSALRKGGGKHFHPPQFFARLASGSRVLKLVMGAEPASTGARPR